MFAAATTAIQRLMGRSNKHGARKRHRPRSTRRLQPERLEERCMLSQTVGVFLNNPDAYDGYTLLAPSLSGSTYLIDNEGRMVNSWTSNYEPMTSYLITEITAKNTRLKNGDMIRAARLPNPSMNAAGASGRIEAYNWNGNLKWSYTLSNYSQQLHHDFEVMPNGNVLMICWERKTREQAIAAGRDPYTLDGSGHLWIDTVIEVKPNATGHGGKIVWKWSLWDHLAQNRFPDRANYRAKLSNNPQLININFETAGEAGAARVPEDWTHANGIDYNAKLDQIVLSIRDFSEMWIIEHTATTKLARGHAGGQYGKGGDLLYRWGNPRTYGAGTKADQMMWYQHDAHWVPDGYPGSETGNITVFDNGVGRPGADHSAVLEITPPYNPVTKRYTTLPGKKRFGPAQTTWQWTDAPKPDFYSAIISGAIRLPNGNTLINEGVKGKMFEVTPTGKKVWVYVNPVTPNGPLQQGQPIPPSGFLGTRQNFVFRAHKYGPNSPALKGKTLIPGRTIEFNEGDTAGLWIPGRNTWHLNNRSNGSIGNLFSFDLPNVTAAWTPVAGDWNGNGRDTVGLYNKNTNEWYLNNRKDGTSQSVIRFNWGPFHKGWKPVTGDWDGDGFDTVGMYNPNTNTWRLNNNRDGSAKDIVVVKWGKFPKTYRPIAGDWNGDGVDTIGIYSPGQNKWWLNNRTDGSANNTIVFKGPQHNAPWRIPIAGDWELDGRDSVGLYDQYTNTWYLNRRNVGAQKHVISFRGPSVPSTWMPIVGNWNGSVLPGTPAGKAAAGAAPEGEAGLALSAGQFVSGGGNTHAELDVNQDGSVTSLDVLTVISILASPDSSMTADKSADAQHSSADVNGDGIVTPVDALLVVSHLNRADVSLVGAEGESNGELAGVEASLGEAESGLEALPPSIPASSGLVGDSYVSTDEAFAEPLAILPVDNRGLPTSQPTRDEAEDAAGTTDGLDTWTPFDGITNDLAADIAVEWYKEGP